MPSLPGSILFCCDHNSVRSPMAEGLMKHLIGKAVYVQSAGLTDDREIDGYSVAVCQELSIELARHQTRSFETLEDAGDELSSYDLIICLSLASFEVVKTATKGSSTDVEYWETADPTPIGEVREEKLSAYRAVRDQLIMRMKTRFDIID